MDASEKKKPHLFFLSQKLRNFHSLSCPGITGEDCCESSQAIPAALSCTEQDTDDSRVNEHDLDQVHPQTKEDQSTSNVRRDPTIEEAYWNADVQAETRNGKDGGPLWAGLCSMRKDMYQLGGELDIEQIERN